MQFEEVIGQHEVKQQLTEMVSGNRLSHALLFLGKEGSGALPLAIAFAQYITGRGSEGAILDALIHPDIHFSYPVVTKKAGSPPLSTDYITEWREFIKQMPYGNVFDWLQSIGADNKQGNITAQECNDIIRKLSLKSFESGYKILILWMPEYLGKEGNKLLKLIEEPPADTLFILVAESESAVLATILSRCQLVRIPAIDTAAIEEKLLQKNACTPEQARRLANISDGNYRETLQLLQHADEDFGQLLRDWLNATLKNQPSAQVKLVEELARLGREKQKQFLKYFIHLLESAIRMQFINEAAGTALTGRLSAAESDFVPRLNKAMTIEQKEAVAEELNKASYYIERNANAKILFHALTIKIYHIVRDNVVMA